MMSIPKSVFKSFRHDNKNKRWGQAFYDHMRLHKVYSERNFCDRLYNETDDFKAKEMVKSRLDPGN